MTKVEEWTKAETGVGAAMAAGSQDENGIWALLVQADTIKIKTSALFKGALCTVKKINDHDPVDDIIATQINRPTSPIRFVRAVIMPAP